MINRLVKGGQQGLHLGVDCVVLSLRQLLLAGENPVAREARLVVAPVVDGVGRVVGVDDPHVVGLVLQMSAVVGELDCALAVGLARAR